MRAHARRPSPTDRPTSRRGTPANGLAADRRTATDGGRIELLLSGTYPPTVRSVVPLALDDVTTWHRRFDLGEVADIEETVKHRHLLVRTGSAASRWSKARRWIAATGLDPAAPATPEDLVGRAVTLCVTIEQIGEGRMFNAIRGVRPSDNLPTRSARRDARPANGRPWPAGSTPSCSTRTRASQPPV